MQSRKRKEHDDDDVEECFGSCGQESKAPKSECYEDDSDVVHNYLRNWKDGLSQERQTEDDFDDDCSTASELSWNESFLRLSDSSKENKSPEAHSQDSKLMLLMRGPCFFTYHLGMFLAFFQVGSMEK